MIARTALALFLGALNASQTELIDDAESMVLETVIEDASRGIFPLTMQTVVPGAASYGVTTHYAKIASAAVAARNDGRGFTVNDVTPDLLTVDIDVTPPAKSSEDTIRLYDEREADHANHGPLDHCVDIAVHHEIVHALSADVTWYDGTDVQAGTTADDESELTGRDRNGIKVTVPVEAVRRSARLRVRFSNGRERNVRLDPRWLRPK